MLDALDRALRDMSNLSSFARTNLSVNEVADTVPPKITSVAIDIETGHLTLQFDEYILASTSDPSLFAYQNLLVVLAQTHQIFHLRSCYWRQSNSEN